MLTVVSDQKMSWTFTLMLEWWQNIFRMTHNWMSSSNHCTANIRLRNLMISSLCCIADMERTVLESNWNPCWNIHYFNSKMINSATKNNSSKNLVSKIGKENYSKKLFKLHPPLSGSAKIPSQSTSSNSSPKITSTSNYS